MDIINNLRNWCRQHQHSLAEVVQAVLRPLSGNLRATVYPQEDHLVFQYESLTDERSTKAFSQNHAISAATTSLILLSLINRITPLKFTGR